MAEFKHVVINRCDIHKYIKSRLNSRNGCNDAVRILLSSHLLSVNVKTNNIQSNTTLPLVLYERETFVSCLKGR